MGRQKHMTLKRTEISKEPNSTGNFDIKNYTETIKVVHNTTLSYVSFNC